VVSSRFVLARTPRLALTALLALPLLSGCASYLSRAPGSYGRPSAGWQVGAARFADQGRTWRVLRDDAMGGQHWGTARIVSLVEQVARGASPSRDAIPLTVGDFSALHGGQIPHHASHRAGRDVDLLFFTRDGVTNAPLLTPEFVRYDREGNSVRWPVPLRFDAPRNWSIVESVVQARGVGVLRIFVAAWIERLLLTHARSVGRPAWIVQRAESLMHQPGDAAPHDDHFHVRIACTPDERAAGCVDYGPMWTWLEKDWEKGDSAPADDATILAVMAPLREVAPTGSPSRRRR
jgi:penicillin-insensitive murein endopeptidase